MGGIASQKCMVVFSLATRPTFHYGVGAEENRVCMSISHLGKNCLQCLLVTIPNRSQWSKLDMLEGHPSFVSIAVI